MAAKRLLTAAAFIGVALFVSVSFVSYDGVSDPHEMGPWSNLCGDAGVAVADALLSTFGAGAFVLAFFALFVGHSMLTSRPFDNPFVKCLGALLATATLATIIQALDPTAGYARSPYLLGGVVGDVAAATMVDFFGGVGSTLLLALLLLASTLLATDTFFMEAAAGIPELGESVMKLVRRPAVAVASVIGGIRGGTATKSRPSRAGRSSRAPARTAVDIDDLVEELEEDEALLDDAMLEEDAEEEDDIEALLEEDEEEEELEDDYFGAEFEVEEELEDEVELEDDDDDDAEEEDDEDVVDPVRSEPVIRRGSVRLASDTVEILQLSREKHVEGKESYPLPPLNLLDDPITRNDEERDSEIRRKGRKLEETLQTFGIDARVVEISRGPTITVYEIELAAGTKVKRITALPDDISMALKARTIRIVAPIPGKSTVGIEVPNDHREPVMLKELARSDAIQRTKINIPLFLGKDGAGNPVIEDLTQMPHLLIAGQTGSGKSVCINSVILSLLLTKYPEEVRLILIDPKMVELQAFRSVPHLLTPVVTDMRKAPKVLDWAVNEMEHRYELLSAAGVRHMKDFNNLGEEVVRERLSEHFSGDELDKMPTSLPYVVVVVDELADLMMTSAKEVETSICRLAQKSRAVGIHVILATQRPSVDVITGLIKSNMPSRISFRVASKIDSRTILDQMGADRLLGKGDMLLMSPRTSGVIRSQAVLVSDEEIKRVVSYIKEVAQPEYSRELTQVESGGGAAADSPGDRDPLYESAIRAVLASRRGSVSMLQRKLEIGYTRAARLVDFMAEDGIVGAYKGSKAREVLLTLEEWEQGRTEEA